MDGTIVTIRALSLLTLAIAYFSSPLSAQTYHLNLTDQTAIPIGGLPHVTVLTKSPRYALTLPPVDTSGALFFSTFYTGKTKGSSTIGGMVVPGPAGELIYLDSNRNGHLEDDGPPVLFPREDNSFFFDIVSQEDKHQQARIRFQRKPDFPDSELVHCLTSTGDLTPRYAQFWATVNSQPAFSGARGSYYFDTRIGVRKTVLSVGPANFEVGLYDWSNDGLFNDDEDLLLVRSILAGEDQTFDEYSLTDVFNLGDERVLVTAVDKYGTWVDLRATTRPATSRLANQRPSLPPGDTSQVAVVDGFWNTPFKTLDGHPFDIRKYRGKTLLLNFWGEWCKPCVAEIPTLLEAKRVFGSKELELIGLVYSHNLDKARALVRDRHMSWPQLILTDAAAQDFGIRAYPTNILVMPDGRTFVQKGQLSKTFLDERINRRER